MIDYIDYSVKCFIHINRWTRKTNRRFYGFSGSLYFIVTICSLSVFWAYRCSIISKELLRQSYNTFSTFLTIFGVNLILCHQLKWVTIFGTDEYCKNLCDLISLLIKFVKIQKYVKIWRPIFWCFHAWQFFLSSKSKLILKVLGCHFSTSHMISTAARSDSTKRWTFTIRFDNFAHKIYVFYRCWCSTNAIQKYIAVETLKKKKKFYSNIAEHSSSFYYGLEIFEI